MKVYIGYDCYFNGCDDFRKVVKVFDCEEKAICWKEDKEKIYGGVPFSELSAFDKEKVNQDILEEDDNYYREYKEMVVE